MVQRTSERLNVETGRTPEVAVQGGGRVGPQNTGGMFDNQVATKHGNFIPTPSGTIDPILGALFGVGMKVTDALVQQQQQQAYLDGALAVGTIESEDQLESNLLTRQWAKAGYRDTVGRLALSDYEAQVSKDMTKLRELEPKQMQAYLQGKRRELQPVIQSMSQKAREQLFSQLVTSERASLATHHQAHGEFIVNQTMNGLSSRASVLTQKLFATGAPGSPGYDEAATALAAYVYGDIWNGPLPEDAKAKLIQEITESNMAQGDVSLYHFLQQAPITGPDGEETTLWAGLPPKTQAEISGKYHTARGKHDFRVNNQWWDMFTEVRTSLDDPNAVHPSFTDYDALLYSGVENGSISPEQRISLRERYAKNLLDNSKRFDNARAVATGNFGPLAGDDVSLEKASRDYMSVTVNEYGGDLAKALPTIIRTANDTGNTVLMGQVGEYVRTSVQALVDSTGDSPPSSEQFEVIKTMTRLIDDAQGEGMRSRELSYFAALNDEQTDMMLTVMEHVRNGSDTETAVRKTREQFDRLRNLTPQELQARRFKLDEDAREVFEGLETRGWISSAFGVFGELASSQIKANREISTRRFMGWSDSQIEGAYGQLKSELHHELGELARTNSHLSPEALAKKAVKNVSERTFKLGDDKGVLFLPRNANLHEVFNAPAVADKQMIQQAVSEQILNHPDVVGGGRDDLMYSAYVQDGKVSVQAIDPDGMFVMGVTLDSDAVNGVGELVREKVLEEDKHGSNVIGTGVEVTDPNTGASMRFNGQNSVGIRPENALEIRKSLHDFEGYRSKEYPDGKGMSVGIGLHSKEYRPKPQHFDEDGNLRPEVAEYLFYKASDDMMLAADSAIKRHGLKHDVTAQKLLTNMAYQGGTGFAQSQNVQGMLQAMAQGNEEYALMYLRRTAPYTAHKDSETGAVLHDHRRNKFYVQSVKEYIRRHKQ